MLVVNEDSFTLTAEDSRAIAPPILVALLRLNLEVEMFVVPEGLAMYIAPPLTA